jgi:hypothetical protein
VSFDGISSHPSWIKSTNNLTSMEKSHEMVISSLQLAGVLGEIFPHDFIICCGVKKSFEFTTQQAKY